RSQLAVLASVPAGLLPRVGGVLARSELRRRQDGSTSPAEALAAYDAPAGLLQEFAIDVVDDTWLAWARREPELTEFAAHLQAHYGGSRPRRTKNAEAALHDAVALAWLDRQGPGSYLLTLDASLPSAGTPTSRQASN